MTAMFTVRTSFQSVVAVCTTFDAAADRAIARLERDIESDRKEHKCILVWYNVFEGDVHRGVFGRNHDEPFVIVYTPVCVSPTE